MRLQDIFIYPIKSLGGIRLRQSQVEIMGLTYDRRWMLVDDAGLFLSQRKHHHMALLQVELTEKGLKVYHKRHREHSLFIPFAPQAKDLVLVTVWDDSMMGQVVSEKADRWFSSMLGISCRLVYMPSSTKRPVEKDYAVKGENVSFADAMPYLMIGQGSLDDLNKKMPEPLPMNRFRPNFVFSGGEAFEEDHWDLVKIGECTFKVAKACARCVLTTVDQETGVAGKEPLKTLAGYRKNVDNKVLFGQNLIALTTGKVKIGDKVQPLNHKAH